MTNTDTRSVWSDIHAAMRVTVPEGTSGEVSIRRFTVSDADEATTRLRAMLHGGRGGVPAGEYTGLYRRGGLWMSDTPDEQYDHMPFVRRAHRAQAETALVSGLGIGMVVAALAVVPSIRRVTVVEIDWDVVTLVGPHLQAVYAAAGKELEVVLGDALTPATTLPKGQRWDAAWHDIWQHICADDYEEHKLIRRRYARRVGFQDVWQGAAVRYYATGR
jgi:hypothetical protein